MKRDGRQSLNILDLRKERDLNQPRETFSDPTTVSPAKARNDWARAQLSMMQPYEAPNKRLKKKKPQF